MLGLLDPPRAEVTEAIQQCHSARIRIIMVTGDQPITARKVGLAVGLTSEQETEAKLGKTLQSLNELKAESDCHSSNRGGGSCHDRRWS